jgi:hypothetical protein
MASHFANEYSTAKKRFLDLINGITKGSLKHKQGRWDRAVELALKQQKMDTVYRVLTDTRLGELIMGLVENTTKKLTPIQPTAN